MIFQDEEYFWRPAAKGLHVSDESGTWRADCPESESYDIEDVAGFAKAKESRESIFRLREEWESATDALSDRDWNSGDRTKWPFTDRPFHELAAWLNLELMKNAAEIGYCRFLFASRQG